MTHPIGLDHARRERLGPLTLLALLAFLALLAGAMYAPKAIAEIVENPDPDLIARWQPCEPGTGVTVVVDRNERLGDGKIDLGCAPGPQPDGWTALQAAGFALEGVGGGRDFVCRIDGQPTPAEEQCSLTPGGSRHWSYWHGRPGGRWGYSGIGASDPRSAAGIDHVQGWSFGGGDAPRVEPMNGTGPSGFLLPPTQESSAAPAALAREWLAPVIAATAAGAEGGELSPSRAALETLLNGAIALQGAGSEPAELSPLTTWLENGRLVGYADPDAGAFQTFPERLALGVLGVRALGHDPSTFAGLDLPAALAGLIDEATGKVKRQLSFVDGIAFISPTVEALARAGALPAKALKTVDLILDGQDAVSGGFTSVTAQHVGAMRALAAAREAAGADGLGQARFDAVGAALARAGAFLEGLQGPEGGVRAREDPDPVHDPGVESTALGAVGLAVGGAPEAAERAAKWVSRYQVTEEYAGSPNPETGVEPPAYRSIGAFLGGEDALRNALAHGVSDSPNGIQAEAQSPTAHALLALVAAGPYGPSDPAGDRDEPGEPGDAGRSGATPPPVRWLGPAPPAARRVRLRLGRLDRRPLRRGFVRVRWRVLDPGVGIRRWRIYARRLGHRRNRYRPRAAGVRRSWAHVRLARGRAFALRIVVVDRLGRRSGALLGRVRVPR